jgi:PAS domain S-box-containing protein
MLKLLKGISGANSALLENIHIQESLQKAIDALGSSTNVDRCYIFTNRVDIDGILKLYYTHEWCNEGVVVQFGNPDLSGLSYDNFPGLYDVLVSDQPLYGMVKDLENDFFREIMSSQDIKSFLFTPIYCEGDFWGWIGYDDCMIEREWLQEEVEALFSVARNIGIRLQREQAEKKFLKTKEHFDLTILGSQQGQWNYDIVNEKIEFSKLYMSMLGYEHYEFEHDLDSWDSRLHPEDYSRVTTNIREYLAGKSDFYTAEYRIKHKNGKYIWIRDTGVAQRDENGKAIYMVGSHLDITKLKEQQEAIENQRNEYDNLINNLAETVFRLNEKKEFTFLNSFWKNISGFDNSESLNNSFIDYILTDDVEFAQNSLSKINNLKGEASIFDVRLRQKDGNIKWVQVIARNTTTENSENYTITGSIIDINDYKAAEYREKELVELKTNFVAMASHQFRTPLTVIYSNLELLDSYTQIIETKLADKLTTLATRIKSEVNRLTELMNNILVFGRYNVNEPALNAKRIILSSLIESVINNYFSRQTDDRKVEIKGDLGQKEFILDELFFTYVLTNILSNAFKYSNGAPNPELSIVYEKDCAMIKIRDFGIGVPKDELNKLFNSFFRASNTSTIQGSGLGLVVAKQFMELHKGKIEVDSELGKGTIVTLTLPYPND